MNNPWPVILVAGVLTYAIRLSAIVIFDQKPFPPLIQRALRFVPPAVLSAIIFPELLAHDGVVELSFQNARLLAGLLAILVAWRTKSVLLTILVGMVALWLLQALGL